MKRFWIRRGLMITTFIIAATLLFTLIVMALWNNILPAVLGVKTISFMQALGILLLSKILFGGFSRGWRGGGSHEWRKRMRDKWETMTPEQRASFKAEWKSRCGARWGMKSQTDEVNKPAESRFQGAGNL